jgi:hypothetical protein
LTSLASWEKICVPFVLVDPTKCATIRAEASLGCGDNPAPSSRAAVTPVTLVYVVEIGRQSMRARKTGQPKLSLRLVKAAATQVRLRSFCIAASWATAWASSAWALA